MPARTLYPAQSPTAMNWSEAKWSIADDDAQDQTKPIVGDTVKFTNNSGDVTLDENSALGLAEFDESDGTGYAGTFALGANTLDVNGDTTLDGNFTASAGAVIEVSGALLFSAGCGDMPSDLTIKTNSASGKSVFKQPGGGDGGMLSVEGAGVLTAMAQDGVWGKFTIITTGSYAFNSKDFEVRGDMTYVTGGTVSGAGAVTLNPGGDNISDVAWAVLDARLTIIIPTGKTMNCTNDVGCIKLTGVSGSVVTTNAFEVFIHNAAANWWDFTDGTFTGNLRIYQHMVSPGADMAIDGDLTYNNNDANETVTIDGHLTITGDIFPVSKYAAKTATIAMGTGKNLKMAAGKSIKMGDPTVATKYGGFDFGDGNHLIGSLENAGDIGSGNAVDFGTANITILGTITGTNGVSEIPFANTGAAIHGGTLATMTTALANDLNATNDVTDGTGNHASVIFTPGDDFPSVHDLVVAA